MRQFSETAYKEPPRVDKIKTTLVYYGYGKLEARKLAYEIIRNLDNYLAIQERTRAQYNIAMARPTQTRVRIRET
jgi:hypothetical protein